MTTATKNVQPAHDEYAGPEFESDRQHPPFLQLLNSQFPEHAGLFISTENAVKSGFILNDEWVEHTAQFPSGATVQGYRCTGTARFLVLRRGKLLMFDRASKEFIGVFNKKTYDRSTMLIKCKYLVYLITKDKHLMHEEPLQLTTKGSFCGDWGESLQAFQKDFEKAYNATYEVETRRGDRFFAMSVFAVKLKPELKGDKQKSWVCAIDTYGVPTVQNWHQFFIGGEKDAEVRGKVLAKFEEHKSFGVYQSDSDDINGAGEAYQDFAD